MVSSSSLFLMRILILFWEVFEERMMADRIVGNGKWYRGITINGDDKDRCKKTITEMGWGSKRNGVDEDAVWLWMEK